MTVALVMLAGAAGAVARFVVDAAVQRRGDGSYPWGTFWINVSGSLALGLIWGWADHHSQSAHAGDLRTIAGTGFCGAFTTFSAFSVEAVRLIGSGRYATAGRYVATSLAVGGLAAAAGLAVMR